MKKKSKSKDKLLTDEKHWLGWLITTIVIIIVFHFQGLHLHLVWYHPILLLGTVTIVDYFKHKVGLQ